MHNNNNSNWSRSLDCKSNKSSSLWSAGACCVSLVRAAGSGSDVTLLASGHVDGSLYLGGRLLLRYALPPTALVLIPPYVRNKQCYSAQITSQVTLKENP